MNHPFQRLFIRAFVATPFFNPHYGQKKSCHECTNKKINLKFEPRLPMAVHSWLPHFLTHTMDKKKFATNARIKIFIK